MYSSGADRQVNSYRGDRDASTPAPDPGRHVSGSYYVDGRADWNNLVAETAETNNNKSEWSDQDRWRPCVSALSASAMGRRTVPLR